MSLPSHKPTKVSVRLETSNHVVLNLIKGLSANIYFCVRNDEEQAVTLTIPGFNQTKVTDNYSTRSFDFMAALSQGIFHIRGLDNYSTDSLDDFKLADVVVPQPTHLVISPGTTAVCVLLSRGSREICHIGLRASRSYALGFDDYSGKVKCKFSTLEEENYFKTKKDIPTATLYTDDQDHSAIFQSTGPSVMFQVVPGVPTPRFQLSYELSSNICNLSGSPSFFLRRTVKSLEPRPVIVNMQQPPWSESIISLTDVATGNHIHLPYATWYFDRLPIQNDVDVRFHEGSESTHEGIFDTAELECLQPNRTYRVKVRKISFGTWRYANHSDTRYPYPIMRLNLDGDISPEIVEAAPTFASVVENIIEAGRTGPFHRLPRELRTMIYKNLEATEPDVLYFRTEAGS